MQDKPLSIRPDLIRLSAEPQALRMEVVPSEALDADAARPAPRPSSAPGLTVSLDPDWRNRVLGGREPPPQ
jgi:hypothetical protein